MSKDFVQGHETVNATNTASRDFRPSFNFRQRVPGTEAVLNIQGGRLKRALFLKFGNQIRLFLN
jgi:hypothetical protein